MENKKILQIIKALAEKRAPSGWEQERGEVFREEVENFLKNKPHCVKKDSFGNYFLKLEGKKAKNSIAIFAHLD